MKSKILLALSVTTLIVGCGKNSSSGSSSNDRGVNVQGMCAQETVDLHSRLMRLSEKPITNRTDVNQINQSCVYLHNLMGNQSCQLQSSGSRGVSFLSYSSVANYCAEIETYVNQKNPPPRPVPVPVPPTPSPRPPRYDSILLENIDTRFALYFEKSYLERNDFDLRSGQTRCQISMSDYANVGLRNTHGRLVSIFVQIDRSAVATGYNLTFALTGSNELARLRCRSRSERLTVKELNAVLDGVAEIRKR